MKDIKRYNNMSDEVIKEVAEELGVPEEFVTLFDKTFVKCDGFQEDGHVTVTFKPEMFESYLIGRNLHGLLLLLETNKPYLIEKSKTDKSDVELLKELQGIVGSDAGIGFLHGRYQVPLILSSDYFGFMEGHLGNEGRQLRTFLRECLQIPLVRKEVLEGYYGLAIEYIKEAITLTISSNYT